MVARYIWCPPRIYPWAYNFLIYIDDLPYYTQNGSKIALYADDSELYKNIVSTDSSKLLQEDLGLLHQWTVDWGIPFNVSKCKTLHISRKKPGTTNYRQYKLGDQSLISVSSYSDLEILVSNTLAWGNHIEEMVSKANKTLGLIKRICKDLTDPSTRKVLHCSLVRSKLEYGSNLWSPHTKKHRKLFENVQRRATKFVLNYPNHMSYTDRLCQLDILPLEFRREISDLTFLFKCRNGLVHIDASQYFNTRTSRYNTRNYDINNLFPISNYKQDYFRNSFFPRSCRLWNDFPSKIKSCETLSNFKSELFLYKTKLPTYCPPE